LAEWNREVEAAEAKKKPVFMPGSLGPPVLFGPPSTDLAETVYECMDLKCVCDFFEGQFSNGACILSDGRGTMRRCVRKEYRMMTDAEREKLHDAIVFIKKDARASFTDPDDGSYTNLFDHSTKLHANVFG